MFEFLNFIYDYYNRTYLKRAFLIKCFKSFCWIIRWKQVLDNNYAFSYKAKGKGYYIVKLPQGEELTKLMKQLTINVVKENKLLDNLPVAPPVLNGCFHKYLAAKGEMIPSI
mmetsp:Transcript_664/g.610  ORF Transcript_664/g.610 Transcript_664/m.610 type:complete len:112 (-) Transcript_664:1520-1855(-)